MKELSRIASAVQASTTMAIDAMFKQMKADGVDVIGFGAGEPDFNTPDNIKAAGIAAIEQNVTRYTPAAGTVELRQAVCGRMKADYGLEYKPSQVVVSSGAKHLVYLALRAVVNPGDEVILPAPYWVSYIELIKMVGGVPVVVTATEAEHFKLTAEKLSAAITPRTKAILLNNPSNPTGMMYDREELEAIAADMVNPTEVRVLKGTSPADLIVNCAKEEGCDLIINNSYGFEPFMLKVAPDYPEIEFISCTNQASAVDDLDNTHNAFANIYEGRYLAGVAGGMKLQQMIDEGTITAEEAVIGYVAAFPFAEVVSGYTAFYQGAKSVCPSVTMKVKYVNSWSDAPQEAAAASALADEGCVLISQHSDNTTPATSAQDAGVFHCGYNNDMTGVAPEASLISCRVDWTPYFVYAISTVANGESFDQDWTAGYADGSVKLTELNTAIAAPGTEEALEKAEADLAGGLHVFAGPLSGHPAQNPDGEVWSIGEGEFFPESDLSQEGGLSAPQFCYVIDGITEE